MSSCTFKEIGYSENDKQYMENTNPCFMCITFSKRNVEMRHVSGNDIISHCFTSKGVNNSCLTLIQLSHHYHLCKQLPIHSH